ncbi:Fanconi anemia group D2 protein isoform X2 [Ananas comosus]|uniref:Fanconi anemia group D2 protein isoform X2 n=1 Tax=Ananas comosus TaxID=4615 RepID=A0A6P5FBG3_ANACO|nr:Fanconi anemia group D2 protein isoform X2 [Ananas comosus]
MVLLQRVAPPNPRKRPAPSLHPQPHPNPQRSSSLTANPKSTPISREEGEEEEEGEDRSIGTMISLLADAGCTIRGPLDGPPSLPSDPHKLRRALESRLSSAPSLRSEFLSGFSSYVRSPSNLRRVLIPASRGPFGGDSLVRLLLHVAPIQLELQELLLEKLPEYFDAAAANNLPLNDDVARLIINQFRWLDFLVNPEGFSDKLMDVLSVSPPQLKKEIIGSLPEIIGDQSHGKVVSALEHVLMEDSEVIVPVLDSFSNLNLDEQLQEQAVTIALSCIRTVDAEHMPHLLRFLLLSATPANVKRIVSQIREQLKFVGSVDSHASQNKKLKGISFANSAEASILEALRLGLRFKNILCEAILKELKSIDQPQEHKAIDVWFLMLIYMNGGTLLKSAEKVLKKKVTEGCFREALFDQCIHGHRELVMDHFSSFLSVSEYLLTCKEKEARDFGTHLFTALFEEFSDTYSRQEVLGALVTRIGSGVDHEVSSALKTMILLTSKYSKELIPFSSHINGILDYLEGFHEDNIRKVYEIFSHLALSARSIPGSSSSSIANELLMIVRKQVSNPDMKYRKMGIIGTLKIVGTLGDANVAAHFSSSQRSDCEEALELLKMSLDSCKLAALPLILLYDELIALLECSTLQPEIIEWVGTQVGEFESLFLADLEGGRLPLKHSSNDVEGELWMNLDGELSPICLNILPLVSSPVQNPQCCLTSAYLVGFRCSNSLQILPSQFSLLSLIERLTSQGSLGGIDALLGCPLHLPSVKYLIGTSWKKLTGQQRQIVCFSLYYAINWIRELLNAFSTQIADRIDSVTPTAREEIAAKLFKRLRNLIFLDDLLNSILKIHPQSLPELYYPVEHSGSAVVDKNNHSKQTEKDKVHSTSSNSKQKHKKHPTPADKSGSNDKLRQPTILDAFKRAGVILGEEILNASSPEPSSSERTCERDATDSNELGLIEISAAATNLESERFKCRPLLPVCLFLLTFSQRRDSCCSDPNAELPLHLYLLRDLHNKLDFLNPTTKQFLPACPKTSTCCRMTACEFLRKIRPFFASLKKHLDCALTMLRDGCESYHDHWKSNCSSAGNPDVPYMVFSGSSVATSVFREVLCCYRKLLSLPDLFLQENLPILKDMLAAFQPIEKFDDFLSGIKPALTPQDISYLYCGVFSLFEGITDTVCPSFLLASEVLVTMQSIVNSISMLVEKSPDGNVKNIQARSYQRILPFLRNRLEFSARKLLMHDLGSEDNENELKAKGDLIQKTLQVYLKNSESALNLLDELACSVLPQVPSCRAKSTQEACHDFPTLCPTMFVAWYRVLHEENLSILSKIVKDIISRYRLNSERETAEEVLMKLHKSVKVVVSLVNMCKAHDKVAVHAMAVKYGGKFVDIFLKAFDFLQSHFVAHTDSIIQMVKELQKATRIIQTLCSEAKGSKRIMITSKIPSTKRSMERFLFHVKALLHNPSSGSTFWMGNLKHKDLYGQVLSSQVYNNGDDAIDEAESQMEADP